MIACGIPEKKIIIVDLEKRKVLTGENSFISLHDRDVKKIEFNPGNNKVFSVMYEKNIEIYEISEDFKVTGNN